MRVMVAIDLEHRPEDAVDGALPWVQSLGGTMDVVHVDALQPALYMVWLQDVHEAAKRQLAQRKLLLEQRLTALAERIPEPQRGAARLAEGPADKTLLDLASEYDLVLVFARRRGPVKHALLGSVAERVVRACPVPIMVLPLAAAARRG